jgi:hypothetical protein
MKPLLTLLILIVIIALILLIPIRLKMQLLKDASLIRGFYRVAWFGLTLMECEISPLGPAELMGETGVAKSEEKPKEKHKIRVPITDAGSEEKEWGLGQVEAGIQDKSAMGNAPKPKEIDAILNALPVLLETAGDILRTIQVEECSLNLSLGTGDAADTARISGYIWSAAAVALPRKASFDLDPYFLGKKMDGSVIVDIGARPLLVGLASVKALNEEPVRDLIMTMVRGA